PNAAAPPYGALVAASVVGRIRIARVVETGRENGIATAAPDARPVNVTVAGAGTGPTSASTPPPANPPGVGFDTDSPHPGTVTWRSVAPPSGGVAKPWQKNSSILRCVSK